MSDDNQITTVAVTAGVTGIVALIFAFIKGLFNRSLSSEDEGKREMREDVKNILIELRVMHDEQTRQRGDITSLTEKVATQKEAIKAAHERIDALVAPPPRGGKR